MDQVKSVEVLQSAVALATVHDLKVQSTVNMVLSLLAVAFVGVNVVCIVLNSYDNDDPELGACTPSTFHRLEFWATFCFNVVDIFALTYCPKRLSSITYNPALFKMIIFVNICGSFISASLVTINLEKFEIPSHELEYTNEVTNAFIDISLFISLLRRMQESSGKEKAKAMGASLPAMLALVVALVQLYIYNGLGWEGSESNGEQLAHYCEFVFGIISACITFWFTMDSKLVADAKMKSLLNCVGDDFAVSSEDGEGEESEAV